LFENFALTLAPGQRTEAAGPLFSDEQAGSVHTLAVPPLFSSMSDPDTESSELDVLYPILTYERFGEAYQFQVLQLLSFAGGGTDPGGKKDRFTLFPIYFEQRSSKTNENYTAVFPIAGTIKNRLFRSEIQFVLWPLYVKTTRRQGTGVVESDEFASIRTRVGRSRRGDITTYNYLAPIFHLRYGDGMRGWQAWPLAGHEHKVETTRTNGWNDVETIPGYDAWFALWPIWFKETREIGTTNELRFNTLLPLYSRLHSPARDSTTYLWPIGVILTEDRARKYRETDVLWPIFEYARGEGKTMTRFWPIAGTAHNKELQSDFFLWPIYKYNRQHADPLDHERTQILFFLYSDVREKNTATGKSRQRVDFWPFYTKVRDGEGNTRLQVFSLIEPIFSKTTAIERNYSPLWSVWRSEHNAQTKASSLSVLWNLYRHQTSADGSSKTSCLFGLYQRRVEEGGVSVRFLFLTLKKPSQRQNAPVIASSPQMSHLSEKTCP
jgi:hypothetical protein